MQNVPHHKHTEKAKEKEVASKTERSDGQRSVLVVALRQKKKNTTFKNTRQREGGVPGEKKKKPSRTYRRV